MQNYTFRTIEQKTEGLYKEKGSKFISFAFPVHTEVDVKQYIEELHKAHHSARHCCWAYRLGANGSTYRVQDDGEPSNTAGKPILGQIDSFALTNVLIVVIRYFGGTLLGVGGLIQAYKEAAKDALMHAKVIEKQVEFRCKITFPYELCSMVMNLIKQCGATIHSQDFNLENSVECSIPEIKKQYVITEIKKQPAIEIQLYE